VVLYYVDLNFDLLSLVMFDIITLPHLLDPCILAGVFGLNKKPLVIEGFFFTKGSAHQWDPMLFLTKNTIVI
jgi:hypothetical protein